MQMSVGTIVTIVLLMTVLVLGLVLVRNVFSTGTNAVSQVDSAIQNEINKLFADEGKRIVVYPGSRQVKIDKTDDEPGGFVFSIKNENNEAKQFKYTVGADSNFNFAEKCGSSFSKTEADSWLLYPSATLPSLSRNSELEQGEPVFFEIPNDAPGCTIPYIVEVKDGEEIYTSTKVFITIQ